MPEDALPGRPASGSLSPSRPICATTTLRYVCAASGSTGAPACIVRHHGQVHAGGLHTDRHRKLGVVDGAFLYGAGARSRDVIHNAYGYGLFTGAGRALRRRTSGGSCGTGVRGATERQIGLIMDLKPRVLCATPSYALAMVEVAEQMGWTFAKARWKWACSVPSPGANAMRAEIQERMGGKPSTSWVV